MEREKLNKLLEYMDRKGIHYDYYTGIAEKGYDDQEMICANWNNNERIGVWIEKHFPDIELSWDDEWTNCSNCYKAVRTLPDCYSWTPSYLWASDCEILCLDCATEWPEDIIDHYKNDYYMAIVPDFYPTLIEHGFICYSPDEYCQRFETGWHPGQTDDPKKVAKDIEENLPDYDYIFKIDSVGQFDTHWSVFLRRKDYEN